MTVGAYVAADLLSSIDALVSVEAGKWAGQVAVSGDPLTEISELERVEFVKKGGIIYERELH